MVQLSTPYTDIECHNAQCHRWTYGWTNRWTEDVSIVTNRTA